MRLALKLDLQRLNVACSLSYRREYIQLVDDRTFKMKNGTYGTDGTYGTGASMRGRETAS